MMMMMMMKMKKTLIFYKKRPAAIKYNIPTSFLLVEASLKCFFLYDLELYLCSAPAQSVDPFDWFGLVWCGLMAYQPL